MVKSFSIAGGLKLELHDGNALSLPCFCSRTAYFRIVIEHYSMHSQRNINFYKEKYRIVAQFDFVPTSPKHQIR